MQELRSVFELHRMAGINLRPNKTKLFQNKTKYLGFDISAEGIEMRPSYIEKVLEWAAPKMTKQLRTFLGFTSYYRSFDKDYAHLTAEMNAIRMKKKLEWMDIMEHKFHQLKQKVAESLVRSYPKYNIPNVWPH